MAILECIEVAHLVDKWNITLKPSKSQGCEQPIKKSMPSMQIPKTSTHACADRMHMVKNCKLCKKYGGTNTAHNTTEWYKYNKDGTPTWGSFRQSVHKPHKDLNHKRPYVQMAACMEKLEKSLKKVNKMSKKWHCYYSSDSNSGSFWNIWSSWVEKNQNVCKKLNLILYCLWSK